MTEPSNAKAPSVHPVFAGILEDLTGRARVPLEQSSLADLEQRFFTGIDDGGDFLSNEEMVRMVHLLKADRDRLKSAIAAAEKDLGVNDA